ncbi:MAG: DUF2069 domain-containing protein [Leucothrix sp.]
MKTTTPAYLLTLFSMFGLLVTVITWNGWLTTHQQMPRSLEIALFCLPLLFFIRGVLYGKRGIYVSLMVVAFFYFLVGIWHIVEPSERAYGIVITLLSIGLYFGGYLYAKSHDKLAQATLDAAADELSVK